MCFFLLKSAVIYLFVYLFWLPLMACGILVSWPGIEPAPPAVEVWSLNHWTSREVQINYYFFKFNSFLSFFFFFSIKAKFLGISKNTIIWVSFCLCVVPQNLANCHTSCFPTEVNLVVEKIDSLVILLWDVRLLWCCAEN